MNCMKSFRKLAAVAAVLATFWLATTSARATGSTSLVIAELYGAGGNSGAILNADYAVLFNRGSASQSINGWSLQYASATGSSWTVVALPNVSIPVGSYYLVKFAGGTTGTVFTADFTSTAINMAAAGGKLALVSSTTALTVANPAGGATVVDLVGASTANGFEGTGPAPAMTASMALRRSNAGCTDTDNNASDLALFTLVANYQPNSSTTPTHSCGVILPPIISSIAPASISTNAGNAVSFYRGAVTRRFAVDLLLV